jgi:hypothetical protein
MQTILGRLSEKLIVRVLGQKKIIMICHLSSYYICNLLAIAISSLLGCRIVSGDALRYGLTLSDDNLLSFF